ncbi:MAG: CoA-binding protein [Deltaproteobacteria bacterium]|nr:CoA-binding protein [Deltaproteobacteria bacterium]
MVTKQAKEESPDFREANDHFLHSFFYPGTVAVVGATRNSMKMNFHLAENLKRLNFQGKVFPVNPRADNILGIKAYSRLKDVPEKIDMVVLATPVRECLGIIKECVEIGIRQLVIVSGGFSEGGQEGEKLNEEVVQLIQDNSLRVLGPNTLSPINTANNLVISFHPVERLKKGDLSFVFQSGLYEYKLNWIFSHLGVSKILDLGNKMDINEVDALEYLGNDVSTKIIAMHIESIRGDGRRFRDLLKETTVKKPVIILKTGRTQAGSQAAASHTGSMARENDIILDALIKQSGGIRAYNMEDFFDLAKAFEFLNLPQGNRLAIINVSGGEGVIATDACEANGLQMAKLSEKGGARLKEIFPPWEVPLNPFDAGVCMEFHINEFEDIFDVLASIPEDDGVDCVVMQLPITFVIKASAAFDTSGEDLIPVMDSLIDILLNMQKAGKPFALWRSSMDEMEFSLVKRIEAHSIPVYPSADRAIKALSALWRYKTQRE